MSQTLFEIFRESLYQENLRGAWEFEAMRYGLMARLGLSEPDALELACKIVAGPKQQRLYPCDHKQAESDQRLENDTTMQR